MSGLDFAVSSAPLCLYYNVNIIAKVMKMLSKLHYVIKIAFKNTGVKTQTVDGLKTTVDH